MSRRVARRCLSIGVLLWVTCGTVQAQAPQPPRPVTALELARAELDDARADLAKTREFQRFQRLTALVRALEAPAPKPAKPSAPTEK